MTDSFCVQWTRGRHAELERDDLFSGFFSATAVFQDLAIINRQRPTVNEDYACAM